MHRKRPPAEKPGRFSSKLKECAIRGLSAVMGSTSPALQCTNLARKLTEIDVVTNDNVSIRISDQEEVA
jgi:hypothetical protein